MCTTSPSGSDCENSFAHYHQHPSTKSTLIFREKRETFTKNKNGKEKNFQTDFQYLKDIIIIIMFLVNFWKKINSILKMEK